MLNSNPEISRSVLANLVSEMARIALDAGTPVRMTVIIDGKDYFVDLSDPDWLSKLDAEVERIKKGD